MHTHFAAERQLDAPADVVYRCLTDYVHHHRPGPEGFLPPAFSNQEVLSGGIGEGTVIRLSVSLGGRTNTMTARISEPRPGQELVETSDAVVTVFTVIAQGSQCLVRFDTTLEASGLEGLMNRLLAGRLLAPVYEDELTRLERYAQTRAAIAA